MSQSRPPPALPGDDATAAPANMHADPEHMDKKQDDAQQRRVGGGDGVDGVASATAAATATATKESSTEKSADQSKPASTSPAAPDSDLPPLPIDASSDLSMLAAPSGHGNASDQVDSDASALYEQDMRKRLMEIESSFIPGPSPSGAAATAVGADDTYLFGGSPGRTNHLVKTPAIPEEEEDKSGHNTQESSAPDESNNTASNNLATLQRIDDSKEDGPLDNSKVSDMQSSPAAAAMVRNLSRVVQKDGKTLPPNVPNRSSSRALQSSLEEEYHSPSDPLSTLSSSDTNKNNDNANPASLRSLAGNPSDPVKRPSYLSNRQSSQRSSVSSNAARSDISGGTDNTLGADYALQSGGAVPSAGGNDNLSLSRLPSLGSIAASLTSSQSDSIPSFSRTRSSTSTSGMPLDAVLGRLEEEEDRTAAVDSPPLTPRPLNRVLAPTDTVIAQHIQNIHVPETVAREYREKHHRTLSPERRHAIGLSYSSRTKHNLTLKEQNSKIDKLTKENFDLKLKIHFLDQALQNRSDEGVKDVINKNVQLQTDLANEKKESQTLRRKVRELERRLKAQEEQPERRRGDEADEDRKSESDGEKAELEEEIIYLKEVMQQLQTETERLREENMSKEVDKRRLADYVKAMGERKASEPDASMEETIEMWKDLLQAETARREQADEDAERLREDVRSLQAGTPTNSTNNNNTYNNTRNMLNLPKRPQTNNTGRPGSSGQSVAASIDDNATSDSRASTLIESLKHENAELRRDLSAQTSMLTSRNRERERLQQEIEDLKLNQRRGLDGGRSVAGDSIFERSVSRAHQRSSSRASGITRITQLSDQEREELEKRLGSLRDELAQVKMLNQDLEKALNEHLDNLEALESENRTLRDESNLAMEDLQSLQTERDELLFSIQDKDSDFELLRSQAVETIDKLEEELEQKENDFTALQSELKSVSETAVRLEDELNASRSREQTLESQLEDSEREIEALDQKVNEMTSKNERLDVQLESSQTEVAFLREEQEGDKIKIGDLEAALAAAEQSITDMQAQTTEEKRQREALDGKEKAEIQRILDDLNAQSAAAKDEGRKLRAKLTDKEREAETWKERLETLETNLREVLGDLNGTRSSLLKDVTKLQRDLEHTLSALEIARQDLAEKDSLLRTRDTLLESSGLESRKLSELLEKERQARRADKQTFEAIQRSQQSLTRTIQQNDTRANEIESARQADRRRYVSLENLLKNQVAERNNLLLSLWTRLSTLCGADFMQKNSLVTDALSNTDNTSKNLSGFSHSLSTAIKTVELLIGGFKTRIRDVERGLWKDFQNLERALEVRTKRIDHLEKMVLASRQVAEDRSISRSASRASSQSAKDDQLQRLKSELRLLRAEVQVLRHTTTPSRSAVPERGSSVRVSREVSLMRHFSSGAVDGSGSLGAAGVSEDPTVTVPGPNMPSHIPIAIPSPSSASHSPTRGSSHHVLRGDGGGSSGNTAQSSEQRWVHRLKELERRLKAEREARLLDRSGARKRIEEKEKEKEELRMQLEREKENRFSFDEGVVRDEAVEEARQQLEGIDLHDG